MTDSVRWQQRLQSFDRAVSRLREPIDRGIETLSALEREGTARRFKVAVELAWKTMKDYLDGEGQVVDPVTPRATVNAALSARVVSDGQVWIEMINHRNVLSRVYDQDTVDQAVGGIRDRYLAAMMALVARLRGREVDG